MRGQGLSFASAAPFQTRATAIARWTRAAIIACVALLTVPALAQPTAEQIAARAVASIGQTTAATTGRLETASTRAVAGVEELDRLGAPDQRIIAFGQRAIGALNRAATSGRDRIEAITRHAVLALHRLNAPQALIDQVTAAAGAGRQAINQARQRAVTAVRDAV
jgi:membrane-associated protease RseP (regulator of RpoE activity)